MACTTTRDLNKNDMSDYMYICFYISSRLPVCPHIQFQTEMLLTFASKAFTSSDISFCIFASIKSLTNDITVVNCTKCKSKK